MHEWPLWRAAPQHLELVVNGNNGPEATFDSVWLSGRFVRWL